MSVGIAMAEENTIDKRKLARRALRRFARAGDKSADGPTAERLLQAAGTARAERFAEAVEIERRGRFETRTVERHRIRIEESPLERLQSRCLLAPGDVTFNRALFAAGTRYRELWYIAGLEPWAMSDATKERVDGGSGEQISDRRAVAFARYCMASDKMAPDPRRVVDAVALYETGLVEIGRKISGYREERQASAVAMYLIRAGLASLAVHFGLMEGAR